MKNQKGCISFSLLIIVFALASGYAYYKVNGVPDSEFEELSEEIAEIEIENLFDLDRGRLKGSIDLSQDSIETNL